jgi:hypothetical protein
VPLILRQTLQLIASRYGLIYRRFEMSKISNLVNDKNSCTQNLARPPKFCVAKVGRVNDKRSQFKNRL